jgi:hypothetical protein
MEILYSAENSDASNFKHPKWFSSTNFIHIKGEHFMIFRSPQDIIYLLNVPNN